MLHHLHRFLDTAENELITSFPFPWSERLCMTTKSAKGDKNGGTGKEKGKVEPLPYGFISDCLSGKSIIRGYAFGMTLLWLGKACELALLSLCATFGPLDDTFPIGSRLLFLSGCELCLCCPCISRDRRRRTGVAERRFSCRPRLW